MNNMTPTEFCHQFRACADGTRFARKYKTMRDCYAALLKGKAGDESRGWAVWTITQPGVMGGRDLRLFAVACARRVQSLMKDRRSVAALDVAERYAVGEATNEELAAASAAAWDAAWAAWDAASAAASAAAWDAAYAAWAAASAAARDAAWAAELREQLAILTTFGNPFAEGQDA